MSTLRLMVAVAATAAATAVVAKSVRLPFAPLPTLSLRCPFMARILVLLQRLRAITPPCRPEACHDGYGHTRLKIRRRR